MASHVELLHSHGISLELDVFRKSWEAELRQKRIRAGRFNEEYLWRVMAIWTLPDDITCEIFYAVAALEPPPRTTTILPAQYKQASAYTASALGWIRLSHVCQSWRATLLGMSGLWGRVAFTFPSSKAFPTLFVRAGKALVDIDAFLDKEAWPRAEVAISLPLARSLRVYGRISPRLQTFLGLSSEPMRWLRELRIATSFDKEPDTQLSARSIRIDAPALETACFELCTGSPVDLHFTTSVLRRLHVRADFKWGPDGIDNFKWIVALLRASPLLEALSLSIYQRNSVLDWDDLLQGVSLNLANVKTVMLEDNSPSDLVPLLRRLCAPDSPHLSLSASCGTFRGRPVTHVRPRQQSGRAAMFSHEFGRYLCRPDHQALFLRSTTKDTDTELVSIRSMPIVSDAVILAQSLLNEKGDTSQSSDGADTVSLHIALRNSSQGVDGPEVNHRWFAILAKNIPDKSRVEQLFLHIGPHQSATWSRQCHRHLLRQMTALRTLYLLPSISFIYAVHMLRCHDSPVLPALQTLFVGMDPPDVRFHTYVELGELLDTLFENVASLLYDRLHTNVPVHTVRITGRWPSEELRDSLRDRTWRHMAWVEGLAEVIVDERVI